MDGPLWKYNAEFYYELLFFVGLTENELKRPLKVTFIGEEAEDAGGVKKVGDYLESIGWKLFFPNAILYFGRNSSCFWCANWWTRNTECSLSKWVNKLTNGHGACAKVVKRRVTVVHSISNGPCSKNEKEIVPRPFKIEQKRKFCHGFFEQRTKFCHRFFEQKTKFCDGFLNKKPNFVTDFWIEDVIFVKDPMGSWVWPMRYSNVGVFLQWAVSFKNLLLLAVRIIQCNNPLNESRTKITTLQRHRRLKNPSRQISPLFNFKMTHEQCFSYFPNMVVLLWCFLRVNNAPAKKRPEKRSKLRTIPLLDVLKKFPNDFVAFSLKMPFSYEETHSIYFNGKSFECDSMFGVIGVIWWVSYRGESPVDFHSHGQWPIWFFYTLWFIHPYQWPIWFFYTLWFIHPFTFQIRHCPFLQRIGDLQQHHRRCALPFGGLQEAARHQNHSAGFDGILPSVRKWAVSTAILMERLSGVW